MMNMDDTLNDLFNQEIVRELLRDENLTEDQLHKVWTACRSNPWNAPIMYHLIKETL